MSTLHSSWLWERLLYIVIMVLAIATLVYTGDAQPGNGDSLGPAAFPRYASGLLLCLMAVKILQARVGARRSTGQAKEPAQPAGRLKVFGMLMLIVGFIALVSTQWLPFWIPVALFLIASIRFLNPEGGWRGLARVTVFAVVFGLALSYIVRTLFYFSL